MFLGLHALTGFYVIYQEQEISGLILRRKTCFDKIHQFLGEKFFDARRNLSDQGNVRVIISFCSIVFDREKLKNKLI